MDIASLVNAPKMVAVRALEGVAFGDHRGGLAKGRTGNFDRKTAEQLVRDGVVEYVGVREAAKTLNAAGVTTVTGKNLSSEDIQDIQAEGLTVTKS